MYIRQKKVKRNHRFVQTCSHEDREKGMKQKPPIFSLTHRLFCDKEATSLLPKSIQGKAKLQHYLT